MPPRIRAAVDRAPDGPDDVAAQRVVRSFLIVRVVRGGLMLAFWILALIGVQADHWPTAVAVGVCVAGVGQAALLVTNWRRLARVNLALRQPRSPR